MNPRFNSFEIVLPVFNEHRRLERSISYLKIWAPLLIVDNFSTDNTFELIKNHLDSSIRFIQYANKGCGQTPEWFSNILRYVDRDYFVLASCSELIPPELFLYFDTVATSASIHMITSPIASYTCGFYTPLWGGALFSRTRYVQRFFSKEGLDIASIRIHAPFMAKPGYQSLTVNDSELTILHLRDGDWRTLTEKHLGYAIIEAGQRHLDHSRLTLQLLAKLLAIELFRLIRALLARNAPVFIVSREVASRVFMHISIYIIGIELKNSVGIDYSHMQTHAIWSKILRNAKN
jgi:glycosyltransferase involved in cell wall biosynthesis